MAVPTLIKVGVWLNGTLASEVFNKPIGVLQYVVLA